MSTYLKLMEKGWTLPEIDGMDVCWFFRLMGHEEKGSEPALSTDQDGNRGLYIDQFGIF